MAEKAVFECLMTVSDNKKTYTVGQRISLDVESAKALIAAKAIKPIDGQVIVSGGDAGSDLAEALKTIAMLEDAGKALQAQVDKLTAERTELVASTQCSKPVKKAVANNVQLA